MNNPTGRENTEDGEYTKERERERERERLSEQTTKFSIQNNTQYIQMCSLSTFIRAVIVE